METRPSWLDNLIFVLPLIAMVVAKVFGFDSGEVEGTAGEVNSLLSNLWVWGVSAVAAVRGVLNSFKRWRQDKGLTINGVKLFVRNPLGTRQV